jgi:hypothetical protein
MQCICKYCTKLCWIIVIVYLKYKRHAFIEALQISEHMYIAHSQLYSIINVISTVFVSKSTLPQNIYQSIDPNQTDYFCCVIMTVDRFCIKVKQMAA